MPVIISKAMASYLADPNFSLPVHAAMASSRTEAGRPSPTHSILILLCRSLSSLQPRASWRWGWRDCVLIVGKPETIQEEINSYFLEADFWPGIISGFARGSGTRGGRAQATERRTANQPRRLGGCRQASW